MKPTITFILIAALVLCLPLAEGRTEDAGPVVYKVRLASVINPVTADFVTSSLDDANDQQGRAFLLELDTPGGLDSSMRAIIQGIFASDLPVIVYVSPSGARAASAGALITLAADFAVMAPGTNIGAAHPVAIGMGGGEQNETMKKKAVSDAVAYARSIAQKRGRNVEWAERIVRESLSSSAADALDKKVIDLVADSRADMLQELDGRRYLRNGEEARLDVAGAEISPLTMNWRQRVLDTISNPTVAYLLMMLGVLGIFFEISQPGVILPGAVGAIALLLAFFAFQMLPVNYAGVLLVLLGVILFILEIKVTSFGMLTVGGIVSLSLGSLMLIESSEPYLQISKAVIAA
ncbi:MAG: nodulation protein NfeD, partial [Desulfuromonadales bacterium]|nr:nodulation protein NfeD [Desulfuromonadales bacterium]NIR34006.1 nodulation protein NfeD [Desulfuromonadales bacterium]NIS42678.1 nodulation protein NfeD [Desulfuromonadales bacterium]